MHTIYYMYALNKNKTQDTKTQGTTMWMWRWKYESGTWNSGTAEQTDCAIVCDVMYAWRVMPICPRAWCVMRDAWCQCCQCCQCWHLIRYTIHVCNLAQSACICCYNITTMSLLRAPLTSASLLIWDPPSARTKRWCNWAVTFHSKHKRKGWPT